MTAHFGHLVHSPSGISRFLDLDAPIFGFFGKVVAGEPVIESPPDLPDSRPSVFLVKMVVAIMREGRLPVLEAASNGPDANITRTTAAQDFSASISGRAGCLNIVQKHDPL